MWRGNEGLRLEELLEMAQNTGAGVDFIEKDEFLESIGDLGAILRYYIIGD